MQTNDLDQDRLRRLAALHTENGYRVLSVYVDLDPASFGTQPARASQIGSLVDAAERAYRETELDRDARAALRADVIRVRDHLRGEFSAKGAHGVALFASQSADVFEVVRLPEPVRSSVVVDGLPWLDPLIGHSRTRRCVALVNRRVLRVFADTPDGSVEEVASIADEVPDQHHKGGLSQANYERSIEEEVRKHLEHSAQLLFEQWQRQPFDVLVVGAAPELYPEVERQLHAYLRERLLGRIDVDVEHVGADELLQAAAPLLAAAEEQRLSDLLERLERGLAHGERAAAGLGAVLEAVSERRVETLLYEAGFASPGYVCPQSGWLGVGPDACPSGAGNAEPRENVLKDAIAATIVQKGEVRCLRDRPELRPHGGVAAVLRF